MNDTEDKAELILACRYRNNETLVAKLLAAVLSGAFLTWFIMRLGAKRQIEEDDMAGWVVCLVFLWLLYQEWQRRRNDRIVLSQVRIRQYDWRGRLQVDAAIPEDIQSKQVELSPSKGAIVREFKLHTAKGEIQWSSHYENAMELKKRLDEMLQTVHIAELNNPI